MANGTFKPGDSVEWKSGGGVARGTIIKVATISGCIGDLVYDASEEKPRYIIETGEGRRAAQRPEELSHYGGPVGQNLWRQSN